MLNYSYESALKNAIRVNWQIEDIIGNNKRLDFSKRFLPETLARVNEIPCLSNAEKLSLNQIRGNSYLHIFGLVEEFIVPSVIQHVQEAGLQDITAIQSLLHFAEEESKHIRLFRQFAAEFALGFGSQCDCIGPVHEIANAVLKNSRLGVMMIILYIEWMTQYHYLESVRDNHTESLEPLFGNLLKHHWLEEVQHATLDTLMIQNLVNNLDRSSLDKGVEDFFQVIELLEGGLKMQVQLDIQSLARARNRTFTEAEKQEIQSVQERSYLWTFIGSGITHRNFIRTFNEVSPFHNGRLIEVAQKYCY